MRAGRDLIMVASLLIGALVLTADAPAADQATTSPLEPLRFFLGSWTGTGHGEPGTSKVERTYALALQERFVEVRNKSTYAPQPKNPKGEVHEDHGFVSWDKERQRFVFRQFHVEGFVNQYVADSLGSSPDSIIFTSEAIENIPAGYRARETYRILGPDTFVERFEIAEPGGPFATYSETTLKRKK